VSLAEDLDDGVRILDVDRHLVEVIDQLVDLLGLELDRSIPTPAPRRLQTDYIDLYWLHGWDRRVPGRGTPHSQDATVGLPIHIGEERPNLDP
jgi:hypothetical protein